MKKSLEAKFGPNEPRRSPKLGFLLFSQVWFIRFSSHFIG